MEDIGCSIMQSIMKQLPQKTQTELIPQLKTSNTIEASQQERYSWACTYWTRGISSNEDKNRNTTPKF